jgi:hypothetical protein
MGTPCRCSAYWNTIGASQAQMNRRTAVTINLYLKLLPCRANRQADSAEEIMSIERLNLSKFAN